MLCFPIAKVAFRLPIPIPIPTPIPVPTPMRQTTAHFPNPAPIPSQITIRFPMQHPFAVIIRGPKYIPMHHQIVVHLAIRTSLPILSR